MERLRRPLFWVMIALVPVLVALLVALAKLPYASALLLPGDASSDGPTIDGTFEIGPMPVHLGDYKGPELQAFRDFKHETCGAKSGIELAICLSNALARLFPHGAPDNEFFSRRYDPVADLAARKQGKPGHCVTRSALIATTLLASGIPGRVMQLITPDGIGHNVFEVFDPSDGWIIVDPSYGHVVFNARDEQNRRIHKRTRLPEGATSNFLEQPGALRGLRVYPEPWLYTRTGTKHGFWPFRGTFVVYGLHYRRTVALHTSLLTGIASLGGAIALLAAMQLFAARRRARRDSADGAA